MTTKDKETTPQKEPAAATANSGATPDRTGWKKFGKWRVPPHWEDVTPKKSGTIIGIVGSPDKPKG